MGSIQLSRGSTVGRSDDDDTIRFNRKRPDRRHRLKVDTPLAVKFLPCVVVTDN